jgi:hypothetical protein
MNPPFSSGVFLDQMIGKSTQGVVGELTSPYKGIILSVNCTTSVTVMLVQLSPD